MINTLNISNKYKTLLEIALIFIVPVLLVYFNIISNNFRLIVLVIITLVVFFIIFKEHWIFEILNIRINNLKNTFTPYFIFTTLGVATLIVFAGFLGKNQISVNLYYLFFGWSIPISIVQEFLYRAFLIEKLRRVYTSSVIIILVNAVIFTFMHILYDQSLIILPMVFLSGAAFAWMYLKYPNLLLISLSHGILNFIAIWYGFF